MKTLRKIMLVCMCLLLPAPGAFAAALSLEAPASAYIGSTFTVNVKVDNTAQLAGAAFTVAYDTSVMELITTDDKITSSFFDIFANQFANMPCKDTAAGCPTDADGVDQPLVSNTVTDPAKLPGTGTRLAAARVEPEAIANSDTIIVSLKLKFIKGAAVAETSYDISIKPTYLDNAAAGYTTGQYIPLLVGYAEGAQVEFPALQESADGAAVNTVSVLAREPIWNLDVDGNGVLEPNRDGTLFLRYTGGVRGSSLIYRAVDNTNGTRKTAAEIENFLAQGETLGNLDVDGNGVLEPNRDGTLFLRYTGGVRGSSLIYRAVDNVNGTRKTAAEIEAFLGQFDLP